MGFIVGVKNDDFDFDLLEAKRVTPEDEQDYSRGEKQSEDIVAWRSRILHFGR